MKKMYQIIDYFRVKEWYSSKIPLAMAIILYCYFMQESKNMSGFRYIYFCYFIFFISYFAFNYLLNDFSDMEADKIAGKKKVILSVSAKTIFLSFTILLAIGNVPLWFVFSFDSKIIIMSIVVYILGASYSIKGLRMKERGIWGVIISSFAQRNSPVLMLACMLDLDIAVFSCWMLLSFANGIRYILIHQFIDMENDKRTNIHTFVGDYNLKIESAIRCCFLIEIGSAAYLFWPVLNSPYVLIGITVYGILFFLNWYFVTYIIKDSFFYSFANVPLEDLWNVYLPIALTVYVVIENGYWIFGIFTVLYLAIPLKKKLEMPYGSIKMIVRTGKCK